MGTASMKGLSGINVNDAYTKRVRAYNHNMQNLISLNTPKRHFGLLISNSKK